MAEKSNDPLERREVRFSGWVQGVGFRYTTRSIAARYDVRGFVKNLPDGRVLLVVEGLAETLDEFIGAIEREMARHIEGTDRLTQSATNEFTRFEIRH